MSIAKMYFGEDSQDIAPGAEADLACSCLYETMHELGLAIPFDNIGGLV
jgi:hypothetical protein